MSMIITSMGRVSNARSAVGPADSLRGWSRVQEIYSRFRLRYKKIVSLVLTLAAIVTGAHLSGESVK